MFQNLNKPAFGQPSTTPAFGSGAFNTGSTSSPFGQNTFGNKTTTSGFSAPAFGSSNTLFGSNPQTSGSGLFGGSSVTPVFGQTQTTQPSFGFGTSTSGGLFGNQNANTGLFGSSTTSSAFGQSKPTFGGFGSSIGSGGGLFGQQQQNQQAQGTTLFGQSGSTGSSLFGTGFGAGSSSAAALGTPVKFNPVTGTDTMVKNGVSQTINTRHHCITCMKEYDSKSLEELRLEDYVANRKGSQTAQPVGLFGSSSQTPLFGSTPSTSSTTGIFGDKPLFGSSTGIGFGTSTGGFGATNQTGGNLFGKPNQFGSLTTTSGTGFNFNATTTSNPFGSPAQPKPFGAVAPQSTSLFGTPTSQPSTGFGQTNTGFGSFNSQPNQNTIGLFSQNKTTPFGMATTTSNFTFGQNTTTNTGLFGQKPAATTPFGQSAFGSNTSAPFSTGSQSLFNNSFKAPTTFAFNAPQTSGTSFGIGTGQSTLFGSQPKSSVFGGGNIFNTSSSTPSSGFGSFTNFGSFNTGGNTLLGGATTALPINQQGNAQLHQHILSLASMPYGDSPLFRNLLPATGKTDDLLKPSVPLTKKGVSLTSDQFKVSPKGNVKIKTKALTSSASKKSLFDGLEEESVILSESLYNKSNSKHLLLKPQWTRDTLDISSASPGLTSILKKQSTPLRQSLEPDSNKENEDVLNDDSWLLRRSTEKRTSLPHSSEPSTPNSINEKKSSDSPNVSNNASKNDSELINTMSDLHLKKTPDASQTVEEVAGNRSNASSSSLDDSNNFDEPAQIVENPAAHPTGIKLYREGYYTIPSMDELISLLNKDGSCVVDNFTVGREGYGNVFFPDSINVENLNLDEIVHFRNKEIIVYPNETNKPPVGEGLNRRAQVTLDCVWPTDKTTREPITDPERLAQMDYEKKLRHVCIKLKARFVEYRPQTGSWVFKVDHFSKYGLSDSDEEDDVTESEAKKQKIAAVLPKKGLQENRHQLMVNKGLQNQTIMSPIVIDDDQDMIEGLDEISDAGFVRIHGPRSPSSEIAEVIGASSHKVQLMKASLFDDEDAIHDTMFMDLTHIPRGGLLRFQQNFMKGDADYEMDISKLHRSLAQLSAHFTPEKYIPQISVAFKDLGVDEEPVIYKPPLFIPVPMANPKIDTLLHQDSVIPLTKCNYISKLTKCQSEYSIFAGRRFRPSWGKDSTLLVLSPQKLISDNELGKHISILNKLKSGRDNSDYSRFSVLRLKITAEEPDNRMFKDIVEEHLHIQLSHCVKGIDDEGCPTLTPRPNENALHEHHRLAETLQEDNLKVWDLCVSLWGNLALLDTSTEPNSHYNMMVRRQVLSEWLEKVVSPKISKETTDILNSAPSFKDKEHHIPAVFSLISGNSILEACNVSQENGDFYLAQLLSQLKGTPVVRNQLAQQLNSWREVNANNLINVYRFKLYMLAGGLPTFPLHDETVNTCESLEWIRAFAMHLWYVCSPVVSITHAMNQYEEAFKTCKYAARPHPPYIEESELKVGNCSDSIWDICFHLLKLYTNRAHPLQKLLNTVTYTNEPLDYSLSWFLLQVLTSLGYSHISEQVVSHIHTSFASQLESLGLWHWAVFVLLYLINQSSRKKAVLDMLERHVELAEDSDNVEKENFLRNDLGIPDHWIYEAKATRALLQNRYKDAAQYLIKAGLWNQSHEIIVKYIASDAIINEDYEYLKELLVELASPEHSANITNWNTQGQVLWDYLHVASEIETLHKDVTGYQLEQLQSQLSNLCTRINMLPCPTAKDSLCQSEIAKRTANMVRSLLMCQKGEAGVSSQVLVHLVSRLPLPEDYKKQELDQVVCLHVTEVA